MIEHAPWLIVWGLVVGLDLVSVAQTMIARPLVAGTVAGLIVGDPAAGATVGGILELFALDVLPVGASRYPDYGLGAIAATATASGAPWLFGTGLGLVVGLVAAYGAGVTIHGTRVRNARKLQGRAALLDAGDARAIATAQWRALGSDAVRALAVSVMAIGLGMAARRWVPISSAAGVYLVVVALGAAVAGAANGVIRVTASERWFLFGMAGGIVGVILV